MVPSVVKGHVLHLFLLQRKALVSPGDQPLVKEPEDSGYEIE